MYKIIGADQKQYGPVSAEEMGKWIAEGRVNAQTLIQAEGQTDWRVLSTYPEFASVTPPTPSGVPLGAPFSAVPQEKIPNYLVTQPLNFTTTTKPPQPTKHKKAKPHIYATPIKKLHQIRSNRQN